MRIVIAILRVVSWFFAICAVLAGLAAGALTATVMVAFTCFDSCPTPDQYFSHFAPGIETFLLPCVALEALALLTFAGYCLASGQARRLLIHTLALLVGGLVGVLALVALFLICRATLPVTQYGVVDERAAERWMQVWGLAIMVITGIWAGGAAYLQSGGRAAWLNSAPQPG